VRERRLHDRVVTGAHGGRRLCDVVRVSQVGDRAPLRGQGLHEMGFVNLAAVAQGFDTGALAKVDVQPALGACAVELRQVPAGEMDRDVGRSEDEH
jgi:hypothetical protein